MSARDETSWTAETGAGPGAQGASPSEEELRAAYEAELARVSATDMIAQSAVSLLNVGARRMGPPPGAGQQDPSDGRDLEQARDAIDAARALLAILERRIPEELGPLRDALSRLQMAYAAEVKAAESSPVQTAADEPPPQQPAPAQQEPQEPGERRPGPAESSGRLWVPGR
jgi:hypothetical protein